MLRSQSRQSVIRTFNQNDQLLAYNEDQKTDQQYFEDQYDDSYYYDQNGYYGGYEYADTFTQEVGG